MQGSTLLNTRITIALQTCYALRHDRAIFSHVGKITANETH
jgi:hypothetical protein